MKVNINSSLYLVVCLLLLISCKDPDKLVPPVSKLGINSVTAQFVNEDGTLSSQEFVGKVYPDNNLISVKIPYFFPEDSDNRVTEAMLSKMKERAVLDNNVTLSPKLLYLDLNIENEVTIVDQLKDQKKYIITSEIFKSTESSVTEFSISSANIDGLINEEKKEIYLLTLDDIGITTADFRLSPHASISPNPSTTALNYDEEQKFVVTAFDGVTQSTYTVIKRIPEKIPSGIREGSGKLLFAKKLKADLGITTLDLTGGIALSGDYLVLNTRGQNSLYLDAKTGTTKGQVDLGGLVGSLTNFYNTSDDGGNIFITNLTPNAGNIFQVHKLKSVTDTPEPFITWDAEGEAVGCRLSINGNVDGNAIITHRFMASEIMALKIVLQDGKL